MNRRNIIILGVIAATAVALAPRPGHTPVQQPGVVPAGYVVTVDPTTGELTNTPAPRAGILDESMRRALSTSPEGLREVPVSSGPGTMVHLNGRFQNVSVVTVGEDGEATVNCMSGADAAQEEGGHE